MNPWYSVENEDAIPSPALLVYPDRIQENLLRMIRLVGDVARLRPHVKTHKMPQIIAMKRSVGIDKFKTSTIAETEMTAAAGGQDILLAYPLVGPNIRRFVELIKRFPNTKFSSLVDNPLTLLQIGSYAKSQNQIVTLYVDLNIGMNRTGIAPNPQAVELVRLISTTEGVLLGGLHAYDGHIHETDIDLLKEKTRLAFEPVWRLIQNLHSQGLDVPNVIAAGTPTSSLLANHDRIELGAGTTVLWDFGQAETSPDLDFQNAAVLLARVVSHPTANRICIDLGHKAVASEMTQPRVRWFGLEEATIVMHNEEHMVLETDRSTDFPVGTVVYGLPKHICPTVALYQEVWCIENRLAHTTWPVVARARCLTI